MRFALTILAILHAVAFAAEPPLVIRNATVETLAAGGRVEKATVLVRDGKIAAVHPPVELPISGPDRPPIRQPPWLPW